jgi:hypothetical protein
MIGPDHRPGEAPAGDQAPESRWALTIEGSRPCPRWIVGGGGQTVGMATWKQFEEEAAELAAALRERFEAAKTHVLATLRKDGSPRVSGSEVDFHGTDLSFGSMLDAVKARDLQRDGRCAIHAHPSDPENGGDAKVAGVAIEITDPDEKRAYTTGEEPPGGFHAFRLDLREAVLTSVEDDRLVVRSWRPGEGVRTIRRT